MINKKLKQNKIARNKKRRKQRKKIEGKETQKEKRIRNISFAIAGSKHGARKIRNVIRKYFTKRYKNIIHNAKKIKELSNA